VLIHLGRVAAVMPLSENRSSCTDRIRAELPGHVTNRLQGIDHAAMIEDRDRLLEALIIARGSVENVPGRSRE
jgi:hypothetical protein